MKKNLQNENTWWRNMNKTRTKYEEKIIKILKKYNISKVLDWAIREVHFWTKYVKSFRNLWNFVSKYFKSFEIYEILSQNMSKASKFIKNCSNMKQFFLTVLTNTIETGHSRAEFIWELNSFLDRCEFLQMVFSSLKFSQFSEF